MGDAMRISILAFFLAIMVLLAGAAFGQTISRAFVTSTFQSANMGGIAGADNICQSRAASGSWNGTWRAWVSTTSISAAQHLTHATGAYKRLDGQTIANDWAGLTSGSILSAISITELGTAIDPTFFGVFTNTTTTGALFSPGCSDWTEGWTAYPVD